MTEETFRASVQYDDLKGTSAADEADQGGADEWLEKKGLKQTSEFLLGVQLWVSENYGTHTDLVYVHFLLVNLSSYENVKAMLEATQGPVDVRRVSEYMPLSEFLALYKRFSVCLSPSGLLEGRQFRCIE